MPRSNTRSEFVKNTSIARMRSTGHTPVTTNFSYFLVVFCDVFDDSKQKNSKKETGKKSTSDPSQNPKKSHKKSKTSNIESFKSDMKAKDSSKSPIPNSSPPSPTVPKPITANPSSSKFAKKARIVDEDAIPVLKKIIEFMSNNGGKTPTESNINPLFCSINNFLVRKVSSCYQLHNKIRHLKRKYIKLIKDEIDPDSPELSTFVDLCAKIWGQPNGKAVKGNTVNGNVVKVDIVTGNESKGKRMMSDKDKISEEIKTKKLKAEESEESDDEDDDGSDENNNDDGSGFEFDCAKNSDLFPIMFEQTKKLWQEKGFFMDDLENAFEFIDKSLCEKFEKRWKELVAKDVGLEVNKLKIDIEIRNMVCKMLR